MAFRKLFSGDPLGFRFLCCSNPRGSHRCDGRAPMKRPPSRALLFLCNFLCWRPLLAVAIDGTNLPCNLRWLSPANKSPSSWRRRTQSARNTCAVSKVNVTTTRLHRLSFLAQRRDDRGRLLPRARQQEASPSLPNRAPNSSSRAFCIACWNPSRSPPLTSRTGMRWPSLPTTTAFRPARLRRLGWPRSIRDECRTTA